VSQKNAQLGATSGKEPVRSDKLRFLVVHAERIAIAVAESDGEVRSLGTIPNRAESTGRMIRISLFLRSQ
jgi:hypothetical protein